MKKTLKQIKTHLKKNSYFNVKDFSNSEILTSELIKAHALNTLIIPLVLTILISIEMCFFVNTWGSYFILISCFSIILFYFLFRLTIHFRKPKEKKIDSLYLYFLTFSSTVIMIGLFGKIETFDYKTLKEFNNEKISIFFITVLLYSFYYELFSQIKLKKWRIGLSFFHKLLFLIALLTTIQPDIYFYFQSTIYEILSLILLISSFKIKIIRFFTEKEASTKSEEVKGQISHHPNEWKAMMNEFPIGVVILSQEKKVLFTNKILYDMFELQITNHPKSFEQSMQNKSSLLKGTDESSLKNNSCSQNDKDVKISFEELNEKIGKLEEVENCLDKETSSPAERSQVFSSSVELTIYSHKSVLRKPLGLYHNNSVNQNIRNSTPKNSKSSYSILSSMKIPEKEIEKMKSQISSGYDQYCKTTAIKRFKTEDLGPYTQKNEENDETKKTKKIIVKNKAIDLNLDRIINGFMIRGDMKTNSNIKKSSEHEQSLRTAKLFCTQYKNFKKNDNKKKKYELKVQNISYKKNEAFLILIEDVSYRDSVVQLRENNGYKNKIMTTLSHEIRTPLNGAIPVLEDVVSGLEEDNPLKKMLLIPLKSLLLLQNVLGDAVDFALINSNQLYLNYEECNICEFLKEIIDMFSVQAELKNIEMGYNFIDKTPPKKIIADFQRIRQILVSLLGNSLKNTYNGVIYINIEVNPVESPYTKKSRLTQKAPLFRKVFSQNNERDNQEVMIIKFSVEDDGIGIESSKFENIKTCLREKNPLEVCNNLNKETGCGVGLTISHCLALILGPRNNRGLAIESQENCGTNVDFYIEFYVEKKPFHDFMGALSTIRETKEMTKYSTLKRKDGDLTQSKIFTRIFTKATRASKSFFTSKKIIKSASNDYTTKSINKLNNSRKLSFNSLPAINALRHISIEEDFYDAIKNDDMEQESAHFSQYKNSHQFNTQNFENLFLCSHKNHSYSPNEKIFNNSISNDENFRHFEENCLCEEVLIVDDDAFNLNALELILKKFKKKCVKAYNGDEAINIIKDKYKNGLCCERCKGFKIIFMDYHMPIKNGVDATKVLKEFMNLGELPEIPIIACTAFGAKDLVEEWEKAGMTHFITKPITSNKMEAILEKWT